MNFIKTHRAAIAALAMLAAFLIAALGVTYRAVELQSEPLRFSTVCVGEEVMVVYSNRTSHFDLAYGAKCK